MTWLGLIAATARDLAWLRLLAVRVCLEDASSHHETTVALFSAKLRTLTVLCRTSDTASILQAALAKAGAIGARLAVGTTGDTHALLDRAASFLAASFRLLAIVFGYGSAYPILRRTEPQGAAGLKSPAAFPGRNALCPSKST